MNDEKCFSEKGPGGIIAKLDGEEKKPCSLSDAVMFRRNGCEGRKRFPRVVAEERETRGT